MKNENSCQFCNAFPQVTMTFLKKQYTSYFKNLMVTRVNALKIIQVCTYFTENDSKAYNMLIIVLRWRQYKTW